MKPVPLWSVDFWSLVVGRSSVMLPPGRREQLLPLMLDPQPPPPLRPLPQFPLSSPARSPLLLLDKA